MGRHQRLALRTRRQAARPRREPGDKFPGRLRPAPSPAIGRRPTGDATVPQTLAGPDIAQGPSVHSEERQWDQTPRYWNDTPLGHWAIEADRWDGVDPIPPDEEPVFYAD
ncbi:MAG: hypothetical protein HN763_12935 [Opitutales bacterium]|nr:hypothetical protein [Opitutales bacterium]MBT5815026.1 hypothetical protein [Opitutales bacterium]MBT7867247.1 hypothetical protein [Opitutales bacterium]